MSSETLRPVVLKSVVKGTVAVAAFSLLLDIHASNFGNYLIFLALYYATLCGYVFYKRSYSYVVTEDAVIINTPLRPVKHIGYDDVDDVIYSQGFLARRFGCGTVILFLKRAPGAPNSRKFRHESLKDVKSPEQVAEKLSSMLGVYH